MSGEQDKRARILEAARQEFARYGPKKATIGGIARRAGIGKGTIYLYFDSKDAIGEGIVEVFAGELIEAIDEASRGGTTRERLGKMALERYRFLQKMRKRYGPSEEVLQELADTAKHKWITAQGALKARIQKILDEGVASGEIIPTDTALLAQVAIASIETLDEPWIIRGERVDIPVALDALLGVLFDGIARRPND